jgi:hypothetical protein
MMPQTRSIYESVVQKIGFFGFLSFPIGIISIFIALFLGLSMHWLLMGMFFSSSFLCFGLASILQIQKNELSHKNPQLVFGLTFFL